MLGVYHAISLRDGLFGITQDGIVRFDVLCELLVGLEIVDARGEIDDIREGPDVGAALTERLAFGGSPTSERFREPGEHHRLALVLGQPVQLAVGSLERERRRHVAGLERRNEGRRRLSGRRRLLPRRGDRVKATGQGPA